MVKNSINVKCQTIEYLGKKMNIPDSWEKTEQQTVCEFINGYAFSESEFTNSGYLIIRIQNLRGGKNFLYSNVNLPEKQFVVKGDLLFTWSATFSPFIWNGEKSAFHYHQWKVIPKPFNDKKFVYYHLERVADIIKQMGQSGLGMFHMTKTEMEKFPILKPKELGEQQKIASILSNVDALIEKTQEIIEKTELLKKGLMQQLLTRGIGHKKFKKMKGLFEKEIEIPEGWKLKEFREVINEFSSGATPYRGKREFYEGKIRWITSGELNYDYIIDTIEKISEDAIKKTNLKLHPKGTFLMAITGLEAKTTRGRCAIVGKPSTINQSCMALYSKDELDVEFLFHYYRLNGNELAFKYCQGTKQQSYTAQIVKKLPIKIPPLPEQQKIASILSGVDAHIQKNQEYKEKLNRLKKGLMQNLLTGKIRVKI